MMPAARPAVRNTRAFGDSEIHFRKNPHRIDDERVSLPMANRITVEGEIWILWMATSVGVDAAQPIAVGFAEHRNPAWREEEFQGVMRNQHP